MGFCAIHGAQGGSTGMGMKRYTRDIGKSNKQRCRKQVSESLNLCTMKRVQTWETVAPTHRCIIGMCTLMHAT